MATATMPRLADDIKLDDEPQIFALRYLEGKSVPSRYPGGRAMFTALDNRKLFLNDDEASQLEHQLIELGVRPGEHIAVSRVQHARGGGYAIRVERATSDRPQPASAPTWQTNAPAAAPMTTSNQPERQVQATADPRFAAAYRTAIEVLIDARGYAQQRGLAIEIRCEDVRALAATIMIDAQKGGAR